MGLKIKGQRKAVSVIDRNVLSLGCSGGYMSMNLPKFIELYAKNEYVLLLSF